MIKTIYTRAISVLMKKPLRLWGISLLSTLLTMVAGVLFGVVPGVALCIGLLLSTSMTMLFLHGYRGEEVEVLNLFDCFKNWETIKRVLCGMGWMTLWIFIWSLIPVVGPFIAIVRAYEYRLTPYILVTEPDVAPTDAIKESSRRTMGYKAKMFGADLLVYVAYFVVVLLLTLLAAIPYVGVLFGIVLAVFELCFAALGGLFFGLVQAAFYEEITNPTVPAVPVAPAAPYYPQYQAPQQSASFCPHCGARVSAGTIFCGNCGTKIG